MGKLLRIGTVLAAVLAVLVGLLLSPIPSNLGFYRWLASKNPKYLGMSPGFTHEWRYTFEQLYQANLTGQRALVTGANSGVGYETALALARLGASVTLACRNPGRCDAAAATIRSDPSVKGEVNTMTLDTSSLASVKNFSQQYIEAYNDQPLDMLYLNAGIGSAGVEEDGSAPLSPDGIEMVFATNHVGHHLLYKLLEPLVLKSQLARIVLTSSAGSFDTFDYKVATDLETLNAVDVIKDSLKIYGQSKLAQILFAKELTRRLGSQKIYVNAAHPGAVNTAIWQKNPLIPGPVQDIITYFRENVMWTAAEGALTLLYLGVATDELVKKNVRGKYFHPQSVEVVNPLALDEDLQKRVWNFSDELVKDYL